MAYTEYVNLYFIANVSIFNCYNDVIIIYIKQKNIWLLSVICYQQCFSRFT